MKSGEKGLKSENWHLPASHLPVVVRMRGTNVDEGKEILARSGLSITPAKDLLEAARLVAAAKGGKA